MINLGAIKGRALKEVDAIENDDSLSPEEKREAIKEVWEQFDDFCNEITKDLF